MVTVSQAAKKLREVMRESGGQISIEGARELVEAENLSPENVRFALMYGQGRRKWWRRSEDRERLELVEAGVVPGSGPGVGSGSPYVVEPVGALESPEHRVRATAIQLGIHERLAATIGGQHTQPELCAVVLK